MLKNRYFKIIFFILISSGLKLSAMAGVSFAKFAKYLSEISSTYLTTSKVNNNNNFNTTLKPSDMCGFGNLKKNNNYFPNPLENFLLNSKPNFASATKSLLKNICYNSNNLNSKVDNSDNKVKYALLSIGTISSLFAAKYFYNRLNSYNLSQSKEYNNYFKSFVNSLNNDLKNDFERHKNNLLKGNFSIKKDKEFISKLSYNQKLNLQNIISAYRF